MSVKKIHIEKYDFSTFEKERKPYVMIRTEIIQKIMMTNAQEFLLWVFLESLPCTWKPNKGHITSHFNISDRTYERYMAWLAKVGLIEYRQIRDENGEFGRGHLIVLDGSRFNLEAGFNRTAKSDGTVDDKKPTKVIHSLGEHRTAKFGDPVQSSITQAQQGLSEIPPDRQNTAVRSIDGLINTTIKEINTIKKTNKNNVSVFSDRQAVKTHLQKIVADRNVFVEDDTLEQIVFYVGFVGCLSMVNKKINVALKLVRENKWNIPQGYQGISSQSIKHKEEQYEADKRKQYASDAQVFSALTSTVRNGEGRQAFSDLVKKLKNG